MIHDPFFRHVEYYKSPSTILFRSIELKLVKQNLPPIGKKDIIIDIGCGDGLSSRIVFGNTVTYGLDTDKKELAVARSHHTFTTYLEANATDIPLPDNHVDIVFSNSVIEHIEYVNSTLSEISRILKKGGTFIFTSPSNNFVKYSALSLLNGDAITAPYRLWRQKKYNHFNCLSSHEWKQLLRKYNLQTRSVVYYIDKQTAAVWDMLLILNWILEHFSPRLSTTLYTAFLRHVIFKIYKTSGTTDSTGASLCIIAQKI